MKVTETSFLLRASTIDTTGVGCFAAEDIDKGTRLYLNGANLNRQLEEAERASAEKTARKKAEEMRRQQAEEQRQKSRNTREALHNRANKPGKPPSGP